jgi:hypothetical protein
MFDLGVLQFESEWEEEDEGDEDTAAQVRIGQLAMLWTMPSTCML